MKILLSGSSGLVGTAFSRSCHFKGYTLAPLVRSETKLSKTPNGLLWNPNEISETMPKSDVVVHLSGESIFGLWTEKKKKRLRGSRIQSTKNLVKSLIKSNSAPKVMLVASGIGIYGSRGDEVLSESSEYGSGFLAELAKEWEEASTELAENGTRVVNMRFGIILSREGGALGTMLTPFRLGLGGKLGSGQQWMSWITIQDVISAMYHCIENKSVKGGVNFCSPNPVRNFEFTKNLGTVLNRPTWFSQPEFLLKLMFREMAENTILQSTRGTPKKLMDSGFNFQHDIISLALGDCLKSV